MASRVTAYIGLGANLGDRSGALHAAVAAMNRHSAIEVDVAAGVSGFHETAPVAGPAKQPDYLNAAVRVFTSLTPHALLEAMGAIEDGLGRVRAERWGPRTIDLDLLLYGSLVIDDANLTVPHPRMHERLFVLDPLSEIAADVVHPCLGATIAELRDRLRRSMRNAASR